jgi:hypothetical protein
MGFLGSNSPWTKVLKISCFFTWVLRCNVVLKINIAGNWCILLLKVSEHVADTGIWTVQQCYPMCSLFSRVGFSLLDACWSVMLCCHIAFEGSLNMLMMMLEFELPCKSGLNLLSNQFFFKKMSKKLCLKIWRYHLPTVWQQEDLHWIAWNCSRWFPPTEAKFSNSDGASSLKMSKIWNY